MKIHVPNHQPDPNTVVSPIGHMLGILKQTSLPHALVHPMNRIRGELNRRKNQGKRRGKKPKSYLWNVYI